MKGAHSGGREGGLQDAEAEAEVGLTVPPRTGRDHLLIRCETAWFYPCVYGASI